MKIGFTNHLQQKICTTLRQSILVNWIKCNCKQIIPTLVSMESCQAAIVWQPEIKILQWGPSPFAMCMLNFKMLKQNFLHTLLLFRIHHPFCLISYLGFWGGVIMHSVISRETRSWTEEMTKVAFHCIQHSSICCCFFHCYVYHSWELVCSYLWPLLCTILES